MWTCKHCCLALNLTTTSEKANHSRWCTSNPKFTQYREIARAVQTERSRKYHSTGTSPETRVKIADGVRQAWIDGKITGLKHTDAAKSKISEKARASVHRRLVKSCRTYITKTGESVLLDSSWEEALAIRLDEIGISWSRPREPIKWFDGESWRNYFPDFWLPEHQVYLDPKNPAAMLSQKIKVDWLKQHRRDIRFLTTLKECQNFTTSVGTPGVF